MAELGVFVLIIAWGMLTGVVFSSVGAAGGILGSFGLISVIGIADPNSVKPMAQMLTLATALTFIPGYLRRRSWVLPLGILLSAGGIMGALAGSTVSSRYLSDMSTFKPLFGILALAVAVQLGARVLRARLRGEEPAPYCDRGVGGISVGVSKLDFDYCECKFSIRTAAPVLAGFSVAFVASVFGVGGGFLLVPYMASWLRMPMFIVPATAAIAVFVSGSISVTNYLRLGAEPDWHIMLLLIVGGVAGALLGPRLNRTLSDSVLQGILAAIVLLIGLKYLLSL